MSRAISLTKAEKRQVDAILAVLAPWGLRHEIEAGSPHKVVLVHGPRGGVWRLPFASTPRDEDMAEVLARQKARRLVRDINMRLGL